MHNNTYIKIIGIFILGSVVACNSCDKSPNLTPITDAMITAAKGYPFLANMLSELKAGKLVNINAENTGEHNGTSLHYAALLGNIYIIQALLDRKADVNAKQTECDETPLHWAALSSDQMGIQVLLKYPGVNVNVQNKQGFTPLHFAAKNGCLRAVDALLAHPDIQVNIKSNNGKTPLDLAKVVTNYTAIVALLTAKGAT